MIASAIFTYTLLFVSGAFVGSFCMLVGSRVPAKLSIISPPSHCSYCKQPLGILELIPIVSYFVLKGRCKHCQEKLSITYPVGEFFTGLYFMITPTLLYWDPETIIALIMFCLLLTITVSDLETRLIPNKILLVYFILGIIGRILLPLEPWWSPIAGALLGFGILYFVAFASKGGMGGGDIKLFGVLGIYLGWKAVLLSLVISSLIGMVYGIWERVTSKSKDKYIPFGPFIAIGSVITYFIGTNQMDSLKFLVKRYLL